MALSEIKRIRYTISGVVLDYEKDGKFGAVGKDVLLKAMHDLQVLDDQSRQVSEDFEYVEPDEVTRNIQFLRERGGEQANKAATLLETLWRNLRRVDRKLVEK